MAELSDLIKEYEQPDGCTLVVDFSMEELRNEALNGRIPIRLESRTICKLVEVANKAGMAGRKITSIERIFQKGLDRKFQIMLITEPMDKLPEGGISA